MTSGNLSEEPIATENDEARQRLRPLADAFLMHDRPIRTRCDDWVVRVLDLPDIQQPTEMPLRRSRGYAPYPVHLPWKSPSILAVGADSKTPFASPGIIMLSSATILVILRTTRLSAHSKMAFNISSVFLGSSLNYSLAICIPITWRPDMPWNALSEKIYRSSKFSIITPMSQPVWSIIGSTVTSRLSACPLMALDMETTAPSGAANSSSPITRNIRDPIIWIMFVCQAAIKRCMNHGVWHWPGFNISVYHGRKIWHLYASYMTTALILANSSRRSVDSLKPV